MYAGCYQMVEPLSTFCLIHGDNECLIFKHEVYACMIIVIHITLQDVITYECSDFHGGLAKPQLKLEHEWSIASHVK